LRIEYAIRRVTIFFIIKVGDCRIFANGPAV